MMLAAVSVIWGGVGTRAPTGRIGFLESDGGWVAPWLDRMDRHCDDQGCNDSGLQTQPSALFQRHCWIAFEPVERSPGMLAEYIGPHTMLWATDSPHPEGFFPAAPATDRQAARPLSSDQVRHLCRWGSGIRRLGVYPPASAWDLPEGATGDPRGRHAATPHGRRRHRR